jgi:hypothetical protein
LQQREAGLREKTRGAAPPARALEKEPWRKVEGEGGGGRSHTGVEGGEISRSLAGEINSSVGEKRYGGDKNREEG